MKKIAFFCIPAQGHITPMLAVSRKLVERGNTVRFYAYERFREKITETGAQFIPCDSFLPDLSASENERLQSASSVEMIVQDIRITEKMEDFLKSEIKSFKPDVIFSDSVCFWGKLTAKKYGIPLVISISTLVFNKTTAKYLKNTLLEKMRFLTGLPKIFKAAKNTKSLDLKRDNPLSLIQSDDKTDAIVYTSRELQPNAQSFSKNYHFIGPTIFTDIFPDKTKERPLIYISLGTVVNNNPDFYLSCVEALKDLDVDVIISCGDRLDKSIFNGLEKNINFFQSVNQLEVLSRADLFITHCGMNSVSESLYMATPLLLYPQTSEERAIAARISELNLGILLKKSSPELIRESVLKLLKDPSYKSNAQQFSKSLRDSQNIEKAIEIIESV